MRPLLLYKLALAPLLLLQAKRLRQHALRLPEPEGPREGVFVKPETNKTLRLLIIGDSSAAGVGVDHQSRALAQLTARHLHQITGRTVQWHLLAQSGLNTSQMLALAQTRAALPQADIIISALGVNDVTAQHSPQRFVRDYAHLLHAVQQHTGAAHCIVNGLPPMHLFPALPQPLRWYLGQCARTLDDALKKMCQQHAQWHFQSLQWSGQCGSIARDGFHPGAQQYLAWAQKMAEVCSKLVP